MSQHSACMKICSCRVFYSFSGMMNCWQFCRLLSFVWWGVVYCCFWWWSVDCFEGCIVFDDDMLINLWFASILMMKCWLFCGLHNSLWWSVDHFVVCIVVEVRNSFSRETGRRLCKSCLSLSSWHFKRQQNELWQSYVSILTARPSTAPGYTLLKAGTNFISTSQMSSPLPPRDENSTTD